MARWTSLLLGVVAALLAALLFLPQIVALFGWQALAVLSGSMAPTLPVGGMVLVRPIPADQMQVGDVITFADRNRPDVQVTHRVIELREQGGQLQATTRGDANDAPDPPWLVPRDRPVGRVEAAAPLLGFALVWMDAPLARLIVLAVAVALVVLPSLRWQRGAADPAAEDQEPRAFEELAREIESLLDQGPAAPGQPPADPAAARTAEPPAERPPAGGSAT